MAFFHGVRYASRGRLAQDDWTCERRAKHVRLLKRTITLATLVVLSGLAAGASPPVTSPRAPAGAAERKDFNARAAHLEIGQRIPAILGVMAAPPGKPVATFGLTQPEFLQSLLGALGPEGRAVSVHRSYGAYEVERESAARWGGRVESIFAADGDAHLDPSSVAVVVAQEIDGFYLREQDLWRQAWQALEPEGRLIVIRFPPLASRKASPPPQVSQPKTPASDFAERLAANRAVVQMEKAGFRWIESPKVLTHWVVEVYRRVEVPTPPAAGSPKPL